MSNAASSEDFGVRKTSLLTNTLEIPMLPFTPNSQATVVSVGDGLIQPKGAGRSHLIKLVLLRICLVTFSEN
jgi:hypothetical protein